MQKLVLPVLLTAVLNAHAELVEVSYEGVASQLEIDGFTTDVCPAWAAMCDYKVGDVINGVLHINTNRIPFDLYETQSTEGWYEGVDDWITGFTTSQGFHRDEARISNRDMTEHPPREFDVWSVTDREGDNGRFALTPSYESITIRAVSERSDLVSGDSPVQNIELPRSGVDAVIEIARGVGNRVIQLTRFAVTRLSVKPGHCST